MDSQQGNGWRTRVGKTAAGRLGEVATGGAGRPTFTYR